MLKFFGDYSKVKTSDCRCIKCVKNWKREELEEYASPHWFEKEHIKEIHGVFFVYGEPQEERIVKKSKFRKEYEIVGIQKIDIKDWSYKRKSIQFPIYKENFVLDGTEDATEYLVNAFLVQEKCTKDIST